MLYIEKIINELKVNFNTVFSKDKLDKARLSKLVFNDESKLEKLKTILYKRLKEQALWLRKMISEKKIVIFDVPLLFETDNLKKYDLSIVVSSNENTKKKSIEKERLG